MAASEALGGGARRYALRLSGEEASYAVVIRGWAGSADFRAFFVRLLRGAPFEAYFWETPPVTRATAARPFEFVLTGSPALARLAPDPEAFAEPFRGAAEGVAAFPNLGGDAWLVAPCPRGDGGDFAHLAAFSRTAPDDLQHAFWRRVGTELDARLGARRVWVSTSGLGVAWLHVRFDVRPKYYVFAPYRDPA